MRRQVYGNIPHLPNAPGECEICTNWVIFVKECINWVILGVIIYEGHVYGNIPHLPNAQVSVKYAQIGWFLWKNA